MHFSTSFIIPPAQTRISSARCRPGVHKSWASSFSDE